MNRTSQRRKVCVFLGAIAAAVSCVFTGATTAGFTDATYAEATVATEALPATPPVPGDQSAGSAFFLDRFGRLYLGGMRNSGDGNGSATTAATADPTLVSFPDGVTIVDAAGSSNDFTFTSTTSYMALDSDGGVWTWGRPYPDQTYIGRGASLTLAQSYSVGQVTSTMDGADFPAIIDIERTENQFLALDVDGTMWSWGYAGENLPRLTGTTPRLPGASNTTSTTSACSGGMMVTWHTIWGGSNASGAVATNGLIYGWGYDSASNVQNTGQVSQTCPRLMDAANRALFQDYPQYYQTSEGLTYDEGELSTETERLARYNAIVADMEPLTLEVCADALSKEIVDDGGCPIRQLGFSSRAPRLLTSNGDLYTWRVSTNATYGTRFLGRDASNTGTGNWGVDGSVYKPTVALSDVNYVVPGVSSLTALLNDGTVHGWGANNFCQALGARLSGTTACSTNTGADSDIISIPTRIAIPDDATIIAVGGTQCATWARSNDGRMWAWGGGTITGLNFIRCSLNSAASQGYKIYDTTQASVAQPFGVPISAASTALIRVR